MTKKVKETARGLQEPPFAPSNGAWAYPRGLCTACEITAHEVRTRCKRAVNRV